MSLRILVSPALFLFLLFLSCGNPEDAVRRKISAAVDQIRIVDSHEHLSPEKLRTEQVLSLFTSLHYAISDMWADGLDRQMSESLFEDTSAAPARKWQLMAPFWENTRNTTYHRVLVEAFRDLYGVRDVDEGTYEELSRRIQEANQPGWYRTVLKEKAGIDMAVCDVGLRGRELDPEIFRAVLRLDDFLLFWDSFAVVEKNWGVKIGSFADWEQALEVAFDKLVEMGFVGIKSGVAYDRALEFSEVSREEAEKTFDRLHENPQTVNGMPWEQKKPLQDYMFGRIADLCASHDLPFQIHTGFFYDTWRPIAQANPALLAPFIIRHKDTRFVLMHCGYPYGGELIAMAKNLPNVTVDMCWIYIISPRFASDFLDQAIETLPSDKVLAFGGDYVIVEGSYGHAKLCRRTVSRVLADKVIAGYWSEQEAVDYAKKILRENPIKVFGLKLE
ncbi:MAG: amidohydrolase family protein [Candidatus Glassbacteria bacterium]